MPLLQGLRSPGAGSFMDRGRSALCSERRAAQPAACVKMLNDIKIEDRLRTDACCLDVMIGESCCGRPAPCSPAASASLRALNPASSFHEIWLTSSYCFMSLYISSVLQVQPGLGFIIWTICFSFFNLRVLFLKMTENDEFAHFYR